MAPTWEEVEVGFVLPARTERLQRTDLMRYGGASCDYNTIHWSDRVAHSIGLAEPIAHGMLTMALALGVLTRWAQDPAAVVDYGGRWPRPVPVPDDGIGTELEISAVVTAKLEQPRIKLNVTVRCAGDSVLTTPRTILALR